MTLHGHGARDNIPTVEDPRTAESPQKAVFVGKQELGTTIVVGDDTKEEWIKTDTMRPLEVERYR